MKHKIVIDGEEKQIDIRPMDESLIVYCVLWEAPLTRDQIPEPKPGQPEYVVREFFRKQVQIIGSCLILAWDGDGVIGKMHFTTREMHETIGGPEKFDSAYCYCTGHKGFAPRLSDFSEEELTRLLTSPSRTLRVLCFNVGHTEERWHGHGIAKAMLECLKQWAPEHGWGRLEAVSCPDITPASVIEPWMFRRGAFERRGFDVAEETTVSSEEADHRLREIEAFLSGRKEYPPWHQWYADNVHRLAADPTWRSEYDKDYVMACDL
jgi:GNAT superfamily N-acetyltransferase